MPHNERVLGRGDFSKMLVLGTSLESVIAFCSSIQRTSPKDSDNYEGRKQKKDFKRIKTIASFQ